MSIQDKSKSQLIWYEKILQGIPGFKGYYERELRRDSDKLQREYIVYQLKDAKDNINNLVQELSKHGKIEKARNQEIQHHLTIYNINV